MINSETVQCTAAKFGMQTCDVPQMIGHWHLTIINSVQCTC